MKRKDINSPAPPLIERRPGGEWRVSWKGKKYGPWEGMGPMFQVSRDHEHWATLAGSNPKRSIIFDGREYGPFEVHAMVFTVDDRCLSLCKRRGAYWLFLDGREIGPYRHSGKELLPTDDALLADLVFTGKGKKTVQRCVLSWSPPGSEKQVFFGPKTGESLRNAIEIINAADTNEGVAAEYAYLRLKFKSLGKSFNVALQALVHRGGKSFDMLEVELEGDQKESYYFDISSFYGKFSPEINSTVRPKILILGNRKPDR